MNLINLAQKVFLTAIGGLTCACFITGTSIAQAPTPAKYLKAKVSFSDFKSLVLAVETHRTSRLVDFDAFLKMSTEADTIILDSRSDFRFERLHIKGAKHLSFTDFTQENLGKIIPSFQTRILIYCNNNFNGNEREFPSKVARPFQDTVEAQVREQVRPLMMALNVPTYVNLYGYGYHNVYELDELLEVTDSRVKFEGSLVKIHSGDLLKDFLLSPQQLTK